MKWFLGRLALAIALLFLVPSAPATQLIPLTIEKMAERAQLVLRGKVLGKTTLRDDAGRIYTKIDFQVDEVWKGTLATNHFTIVQGGGVLGEERLVVSGQVEYRVGEEAVVFLVLNQRGEGVTLGLAQGKFEVRQDPGTGQKFARNVFHGHAPATSGPQLQQTAGVPAQLSVSELKQRVQNPNK